MNCPICGNQIADGSVNCPACGAVLMSPGGMSQGMSGVQQGYGQPQGMNNMQQGYGQPQGMNNMQQGYGQPQGMNNMQQGYGQPQGMNNMQQGYGQPQGMNNMQQGYAQPQGMSPMYQGYGQRSNGKKTGIIIGCSIAGIAVIALIVCLALGVFSKYNGKYVCNYWGYEITLEVKGSKCTLSADGESEKGNIKFKGDTVEVTFDDETVKGTYDKDEKTITIEGMEFKKK